MPWCRGIWVKTESACHSTQCPLTVTKDLMVYGTNINFPLNNQYTYSPVSSLLWLLNKRKWRCIFYKVSHHLKKIFSHIPTRRIPVYYSVYCVFSNFWHFFVGICEYFTLCWGSPWMDMLLMFVFSSNF